MGSKGKTGLGIGSVGPAELQGRALAKMEPSAEFTTVFSSGSEGAGEKRQVDSDKAIQGRAGQRRHQFWLPRS